MASKKFFCVDAHTCGNPVRLVAGGGPLLHGNTIMEKRLHFLAEFDWIRKGLMFEPRGHDMMSGSILYPPHDAANDVAVLFIETSGCLPMCGHGTIGTITIAIEEGLIAPKIPGFLRMEAPAGLVLIEYKQEGKKVKSVKLTNVKSFLHSEGLAVQCPDLGTIKVDVAYGGNFYAIVDPQENFPGLQHVRADQLIAWSRVCRERLNEKYAFLHPEIPHIKGLSHMMWTGAHVMQYFMEIKPLTGLPVAQALQHEWRNGMHRVNSGREMNLYMKALSVPGLSAVSKKKQQ
ncbi:MAG: 4-hydroxyproline epimerase [Chitinophagaceae bacterium]